MMKKVFFFIICTHLVLKADIKDYLYPHYSSYSYSNYGTVGLIQMPSARMHEEGSIGFTWSLLQPYLRGSIVATPFSWFEASYQYTDVNNKLYSEFEAFSGKQSYKDKGIDAKFLLLKERRYIPSVAFGFRDLGGSGLFGAEYLVASKMIGNIDFSAGIGWGMITENPISNPLKHISKKFESDRILDSGTGDSQGGEFNIGTFFKGKDAGIFFGAEIFIPKTKGSRLKIELDGTNYDLEGYEPIPQESKVNFQFTLPVTKNFFVKLGYVRGNALNFGFSYTGNYKNRDPFVKKNDPPQRVDNSEAFKIVNSRDNRNLYVTSLKYLAAEKIYLQSANVNDQEYEVTFLHNKHFSQPRAVGRALRILDQISPPKITSFKLTNLNASHPMFTVTVPRADFSRYQENKLSDALLDSSLISKEDIETLDNYEYVPKKDLPAFFWKLSPAIRSQIGGPDGFYFGDISISAHLDLIITPKTNVLSVASLGVYDNFDELKLASDSVLPHVRSDIVKYLKESKNGNIGRLQFNYIDNFRKDIFFKFSAGYFEQMFGGLGMEALYRPFYKNWAIGFEAWHAKQRTYEMLFDFQDYDVVTGHLNFYYREPRSQVLFHLKGGRYLAKDSGITIDFSRRFKSGFTIGVFATKTDISKQEFGEGSFDKGFYFNMPIEIFYDSYSRGVTGFGLRPLTRDGGQSIIHGFGLYGVTDSNNANNIYRDWETIYD